VRMDRPTTPVAGPDPLAPRARPRSIDGVDDPGPEPPRVGRARPTVSDREPGASTKGQFSRSQTIRADHDYNHEYDHEELAILADRRRIAVDLNDLVIRRIFAAGLALQSTAAIAEDPQVTLRIQTSIDELDGVISDIRTTIFGLEGPRGSQ